MLMLISRWTFGLLSLDRCGESCCAYSCPSRVWTNVLIDLGAELLECVVTVESFEELPDGCSKWPNHFSFPPAKYKGSSFSTFVPVFTMVFLWS